jgi:hypothetical protein
MYEMILKYYCVDWLAMVLTFLSLYSLGRKKRSGFLYGLGANASWFTFGVMAGSVANSVANVVFAILNIRGYRHWRKTADR